ncbi:hypothetical protein CIHG_05778 [Coccidioides immitis H538.4]|uniref:Acriflavine sensitivity control protein acr-2 n=1 Tax=Coccidioides immitis H538.4 TaxID=396776 RepID=A0A0J8RRY9_COCIT|nr:hypothetical protein CIHG_05778 [Coccidioides immitis H538.4]
MEFREKETTQANERRQCWECSRRRLTAGITCPGYSQKKPLKWLPPGKVTSRTRRRRGRPTDKGDSNTSSSAPTTVNPSLGTSEVEESSIKSLTCHTENGMKDVAAALSHVTFGTEACAFTQAILYCEPINLIPSTWPWKVKGLEGTSRSTLAEALSNLYHYRGLAIRALGEDVGKEKTRSSDATITSVLLFMVTDVRDSLSLNWRQHFIGAEKLISLRGGLENLARVSPHMKPMLLYYMILGVIGNTTTPPSDQVATTSQLDLANLASEMYGEGYLFPNLLCPPSLFLDILSINHLRYQWKIASLVNQFSQTAAEAVLQHVDAFSPEEWACSNTSSQEDWLLIGRIYQSAVALYCISSLQSVSVLPFTSQLKARRTAHGNRLFQLLKEALLSPKVNKCMMWPLIVAGAEAVNRGPAAREFVADHLSEMSEDLGTPLPLHAKMVFKKFWPSGKTKWDDCFDTPYAFVP